MNMSYLADSFFLLTVIGVGLYLLFYLLYRRSIVSVTDPLNTGAFIVALYLAGALVLPSLHTVNWSFVCVIILTLGYVVTGALFSRKVAPITTLRLGMTQSTQLLFIAALTGVLILNLIVNQFFGVIPLFHGSQTRADAGQVLPSLYLLSPDLAMVVLLVFLLAEARRVRVLAGFGVIVSVVSTILSGSKSAVFTVLILFSVADYVQNLKRSASHSPSEVLALTRRIRTLRRYGILYAVVTVIILPFYLVLTGADLGGGSGLAVQAFATRLFGGFDGLAIVAFKDINLLSVHDVNIRDFYLYPLVTRFSHTPLFRSSGQYLIYQLSGSYDFATSGLNPNSSLAIELLLSNGSLVLSGGLIALVAAALFRLRANLVRRERLRMFDLVLWALVVLGPFSVLLDGTYFVIRCYLLLGLYMTVNLGINAISWLGPGRKLFRLF